MARLSYAETYTELLKYVSEKYNYPMHDIIICFRKTGVEEKFSQLFSINSDATISAYYNYLKEYIKYAIS